MAVATLGNASRREVARQEAIKRQEAREAKRTEKSLIKELQDEAKIMGALLVECWTRLGEAHMAGRADVSTDGKHVKRRKVQRVKFSHIRATPERIWYRVLINKRTLFGYKDQLPHGVYSQDLISEKALFELSMATGRNVTAKVDPERGMFVCVERLKGIGGIPENVSFADIIKKYPQDMSTAPVILGVGENRILHVKDFASHPHWLIGGSTRGGKSNLVNHIIASLMRTTHPDDLKFILIDLKRMEFGYYKNAPHLEGHIIFEAEEALEALESLVGEVIRRSKMMSDKAKELSIWNKKYPDEKLPRIIVIIDEFAELMLGLGRKIPEQITRYATRIANLGRAVGVHLVIATQRPDKNVVSGPIKVNMPLIIAAKVPTYYQSNIILGMSDAAQLPVHPGRMIYLSGSVPQTIQVPEITEDDILEAVQIARGNQLGLITLEVNQPKISPDHVIQYIFDMLGGSLSIDKVSRELSKYAVPKDELKALIADVIEKGQVTAFGRLFEVEQHGTGKRIVMLYDEDQQVDQTEFHMDTQKLVARLAAPKMLALPAPRGVEHESYQESQPEIITITAVPFEKSDDQLIDEFIREKCVVSRPSKVLSGKLYKAYCAYCSKYDYAPLAQNSFGKELRQRGFIPKKGSRERFWTGIDLISESETRSAGAA